MTQKRQRKRRADAKSWNQQEIERSTRSDNARGLNVDEVAAVLAVGDAHTKHVGFVNPPPPSHIDDDRQKEVLPRDVRLTHISQGVEGAEGLSIEKGLAQGHQHLLVLLHLLLSLQTAIAAIIVAAQGLGPSEDCPDHDDRLAVLFPLLGESLEGAEGDQFLVVTDHDPIRTLTLPAHVRPEDAERPLRRRHRASHHHHPHDIAEGRDGIHLIHDRGPIPGIAMAGGEMEKIEDLEDQTQFTHRTIEDFHGLMLSRTVSHETSVV
jgi:hypothetical protein